MSKHTVFFLIDLYLIVDILNVDSHDKLKITEDVKNLHTYVKEENLNFNIMKNGNDYNTDVSKSSVSDKGFDVSMINYIYCGH